MGFSDKLNKFKGSGYVQSGAHQDIMLGLQSGMLSSSLAHLQNPMGSVDVGFDPMSLVPYALGGQGHNGMAEVEGGEVIEGANGQVEEIKGPSHAAGGVPVQLSDKDFVYSKKIKIENTSLANRKMKREKKLKNLEDSLKIGGSTKEKRATLERMKSNLDVQDKKDREYQFKYNQMRMIDGTHPSLKGAIDKKLSLGTFDPRPLKPLPMKTMSYDDDPLFGLEAETEEDFSFTGIPQLKSNDVDLDGMMTKSIPGHQTPNYHDGSNLNIASLAPFHATRNRYPSIGAFDYGPIKPLTYSVTSPSPLKGRMSPIPIPEMSNEEIRSKLKIPNIASPEKKGDFNYDALGDASTIFTGVAPLINNMVNRSQDKPNINPNIDVNKESLNSIDQLISNIDYQHEESRLENTRNRTGMDNALTSNARGISQLRAGLSLSNARYNKSNAKSKSGYLGALNQAISQRSQLQAQRSQALANGEKYRDDSDRQDRDNSNTQLAKDLSTLGTAGQHLAYNKNQQKTQAVVLDAFNRYKAGSISIAQYQQILAGVMGSIGRPVGETPIDRAARIKAEAKAKAKAEAEASR